MTVDRAALLAAPAPVDERGYVSISQAAALLGVNRVTIWRWIRAGRLPVIRLGQRTARLARRDLERVLAPAGQDRRRSFRADGTVGRQAGAEHRPGKAGRHGQPEHIAQLYDDDAFLLSAATDFLGAALYEDGAGVVIATEAHRLSIEERLAGGGLDLDAARGQGRYVALDALETLSGLMVDGAPDAARFMETVGRIVTRAGQGGRRVHAFGEMVALLAAAGNLDGAVQLEAMWNDLQGKEPFSLFCAYPLDELGGRDRADAFEAICAGHSRVVPAEGHGRLADPDEHLLEIARLQQRARSLEAEVAERERAEAALRAKQRELDDFMENATVGLHRVGPDGTILWANQAELELLGYAPEEYIGRSVADFHADRDTIDEILRRLSAREELHAFEARLRCKDGSVRHVLISSNVLWDGDRFVHTRCFTRDITDRVQAEEGRALLARAGAILASSLDWEATLDHVIELAMPALADFGFFDVVEAEGQVRRIARAHDDPRRQAMLDGSRWAAATQTELNVCGLSTGQTGVHPEITDRWLDIVATGPEHRAALCSLAFRSMVTVPLRHQDRTLGALTLFYADSGRHYTDAEVALIEELARRAAMAVENARLYREARAAIRARDEFLSIASHELRNPVAGMKGAAQMLRRSEQHGRLDGVRLDRYVRIIEQTADRLATLTEDLLDVSRLQQGVLSIRPRRIDLAALIRGVTRRLQEQSPGHRLVLDLGDAAAPCPVVADPDRIEQIVENLLSNAVKYAPGGGEIRVTLAPADGGCLLRVQDAGIGLPPDALERIFEPFGRASNAVARNIAGLGLGLYICRRIAQQHGGRLWAESPGEDQGTTLSVWLPGSGHDARAGG